MVIWEEWVRVSLDPGGKIQADSTRWITPREGNTTGNPPLTLSEKKRSARSQVLNLNFLVWGDDFFFSKKERLLCFSTLGVARPSCEKTFAQKTKLSLAAVRSHMFLFLNREPFVFESVLAFGLAGHSCEESSAREL